MPVGSAFTATATDAGGVSREIAGTGTVRVAGATVTVTLASAIGRGETVTAAYAAPAEFPLRDLFALNEAEDFAGLEAANHSTEERVAPQIATVTGVEVISETGPDGVYGQGETVEAAVTFSAPVTVGTGGGAPTLALIADGRVVSAAYASGSDTERLVFAWRVSEADGAPSAVRAAASGLRLNGGTIGDQAGTAAELGFGDAPGVIAVSVADEADGRWDAGDAVEATLRFAEPVTVEGAPSVGLALGGGEYRAAYARGSGTDALVFRYTLAETDGGHDRAEVAGDSLELGGGSIKSAGGGLAAALSHPGASRTLEPGEMPALSVGDAHAEEGGTLAFAVRLFAASEREVTVDYATADGTAVAGRGLHGGGGHAHLRGRGAQQDGGGGDAGGPDAGARGDAEAHAVERRGSDDCRRRGRWAW